MYSLSMHFPLDVLTTFPLLQYRECDYSESDGRTF